MDQLDERFDKISLPGVGSVRELMDRVKGHQTYSENPNAVPPAVEPLWAVYLMSALAFSHSEDSRLEFEQLTRVFVACLNDADPSGSFLRKWNELMDHQFS